MFEDTELVWAPNEGKPFHHHHSLFLDNQSYETSTSPSSTTALWPRSSLKTPVRDTARLPIFATSPADKIFIEPADLKPEAGTEAPGPGPVDLVRHTLLASKDKSKSHSTAVYAVDISPGSHIIASKHGDRTIRIHSLLSPTSQNPGTTATTTLQATLKVSFYVTMQERSRDFFVHSHAILSKTRTLIAVAAGFGHTLEIWDWVRKKKLQTMESAYRWAAAAPTEAADMYEKETSCCSPLVACYREDSDSIAIYPVAPPSLHGAPTTAKHPPFGAPTLINLTTAGLPHIPKFPELAISSSTSTTATRILVAAAGPRPPRPGHPPPQHAAMLIAWTLPANEDATTTTIAPPPRLWRVALPTQHTQLATALPCGLATHGNVAVSIWIPHGVRVIGRPGAWQVEPVAAVQERYVLVWRLEGQGEGEGEGEGTTSVFAIPNQNTLACVSPDCRFVAYRQGPGADTAAPAGDGGARREVCLVVLDALRGGKEVWRTPGRGGGGCRLGGRDCGQFMDLSRVSALAFSGDGTRLLIGDTGGAVGVYEIRTGTEGHW